MNTTVNELLRSAHGRATLRSIKSMPSFLKTLAERTSSSEERAEERYRKAISEPRSAGRVPRPSERLEFSEIVGVVERAIEKLPLQTRRVFDLYREGRGRRDIARLIWHRGGTEGLKRVKALLEDARERIWAALQTAFAASCAPRKKKWRS